MKNAVPRSMPLVSKFSILMIVFASFFLVCFGVGEYYYSVYLVKEKHQSILDNIQNNLKPFLSDELIRHEINAIELKLRLLASHDYVAVVEFNPTSEILIKIGEDIPFKHQRLIEYQVGLFNDLENPLAMRVLKIVFDQRKMQADIHKNFLAGFLREIVLVIFLLLLCTLGCYLLVGRPLKRVLDHVNSLSDFRLNQDTAPNNPLSLFQSQEIDNLYKSVNDLRLSAHRQMTRHTILQKRLARYTSLLKTSNGQLRSVFESIGDIVIVTNQHFHVEYFNQKAHLLGLNQNDFIEDIHVLEFIQQKIPIQLKEYNAFQVFAGQLNQGEEAVNSIETVLQNGCDTTKDFIVSYAKFEMPSQEYGYVFFFNDVTENRALFSETRHLASHDYLTDVLNRYAFECIIKPYLGYRYQEIQSMNKPDAVLLYININHFRIVNNSVGRIAGDALLRQMAHAIDQFSEGKDRVARLEGDIFAVVMDVRSSQEAQFRTRQLYIGISKMVFTWQQHKFEVSISIGAVLLPHTVKSVDDLLAIADGCCRRAKLNGQFKIEFFSSHVEEVIRGEQRGASSVLMLEESIRQKTLKLYLQPIQSLQLPACHKFSFEILVRIQHPHGHLIYPDQFIPSAEQYHKVKIIDEYVIRSFLEFAVSHRAWFNSLDHVAINLSGESLTTDFMKHVIEEPILSLGLNPRLFCFEVTETVAVSNLTETVKIIENMKQKGFRFSLDDFGTGFSSYEYLHHLPVDYLKIDGSFVRQICDNSMSFKVVESMNAVAHHAGIKTVAEYVENETILEKVVQLSMDYAQGYVHGKARLIDDVVDEFEKTIA